MNEAEGIRKGREEMVRVERGEAKREARGAKQQGKVMKGHEVGSGKEMEGENIEYNIRW